jgi:hypothetical protein
MRTYFEKSRTAGVCKQCGTGIAKGTPAWWSQNQGWQCTGCSGSGASEQREPRTAKPRTSSQPKPAGLKGTVDQRPGNRFEVEFERMVDALDTATALGAGPGKSVAELDSRVRKHQRTEWLGFRTTEGLRTVLEQGREDLTAMVEKMRERISNELPIPTANKRQVRRGRESGDEIDADRFLSRIPEMWNRIECDEVPANRVVVKVNAAVSGSQKERHMAYRAAAALALADALTERGASVEVQLIWCSRDKTDEAEQTVSKVVVKRSDQPMSVADLAAACCDVGVVRMGLVIGTARMLPGRLHSGLGFPMEMPDDLRAEGFTVDRNIESERDAIEWVKATVQRFTEN